MSREEIAVTSFDHEELKQSLIDFLKATGKFSDFNFEGSALNTIIDLLVRNGHHDAFLANMLANESFIQSAQIRQNVVAHAEKLSYVARSTTAARLICTIEVVPVSTTGIPTSINLPEGTSFVGSVGGETYTFTNNVPYTLTFNSITQSFRRVGVELFQGFQITNDLLHVSALPVEIPNSNCDTSTLSVTGTSNGVQRVYTKATSLTQLSASSSVFFLSENSFGRFNISFGRNLLGDEPDNNSTVTAKYIVTTADAANGVTSLTAGSLIGGYANVQIDVTTPSYGGADKEDIEDIRFFAPKYYQAQGRGLTDRDYIPLLKEQFSFIRAAVSWGGEKNKPPVYGTVFVSILSEEGGLITNSVKQQMEDYLSDFNVGSITPTITDPEQYGIDLSIAFSIDNRLTAKSFNQLAIDIKDVVSRYNEELFNFDQYYNEAELNKRIMAIKGVTSLDIDKEQFFKIDVLRFENPVYTIDFANEIEPGTIRMEDFSIASNGTNHLLFDVDGEIFVSYTNDSSQEVSRSVGSVNYVTGQVEFTLNMIQTANQVTLYVQTLSDNFYVQQNKVVYINSTETSLLETVDRVTQSLRQ
jgi:hypothetical protein